MWPTRHHLLQHENHPGHQRHLRRRHGDHLHHTSGRTLIICGVQSAPPGWTVVAVVQTYLCVYARGGGIGDNAVSIRKL
ncbi:hypothetical protein [Nonomuraea guangzhouensis]|uniref:Uncharacterized protein n=1 Tax=Nonomuraea guangzhouensis TaxID=1291555 RepID=A0ABW4GF79_9ACTN|nr:hypothetical protein [Nonomuraea guangzhouensis]